MIWIIGLLTFTFWLFTVGLAYRNGWNDCKQEQGYIYDYDDYIDHLEWQEKQYNNTEYPQEMLN